MEGAWWCTSTPHIRHIQGGSDTSLECAYLLSVSLTANKHVSSPLFTKSRTVHLPMPVLDPVTIAVFPSSRVVLLYLEQPTIVTFHCDSCHCTHWGPYDMLCRLRAHCRARYSARVGELKLSLGKRAVSLTLPLSLSLQITRYNTAHIHRFTQRNDNYYPLLYY